MTYCPKCGTANRDGSRFCNECGEILGTQTHVECPHCGTVNPIQNVLCSECSGRLPSAVPSPADAAATPTIKGLSLPTKNPIGEQDEEDDAEEPDDEAPAWLRELGASISEEGDSNDADPLEDTGEIPDWLRDLRASLPDESEEKVSSGDEEETLPDWLEAPGPIATEAEVEPSSPESDFEPEPPDPEAPTADIEAVDEPPTPEAGEDEVPGWLSRLVPTAAAASAELEPAASEEETPGWLTRLVPGETEDETEPAPPAAEAEEGGIADGAADLEPAGEEAGTEAEQPAAEAEEGEIPDWLADLQPPDEEIDTDAAPLAVETEEGEAPDWMDELQPTDMEAEPEAVPSAIEIEEGEVPDRMDELQPTDVEAELKAVPSATGIEEGEIPDWLADLEPTDEEAEAEAVLSAAEIEEGETPDWLADLEPTDEEAEAEAVPSAAEIEEGEIPDWMAELEPADEEAETEAMPPAVEIEEGEIPDWVAELRPTDEEIAAGAVLAAIEIEGEQFPDRVTELEPPSEELPLAETLDSLDEDAVELLEDEAAVKLPDEVEAALGPAVPAWLAELQTESPEAAQAIIEENLVDGELPDWLVRSEIEPDEALAPAEIPGWLLALKPTELREEGEEVEIPSAAVSEESGETGLLAGIQGALPVEMLIAQPRAIAAAEALDVTVEDSPPARLFADVVGRPPEAAPKEIVSPKADVLPQLARWIIFAILIIVVALPIIIGEPLLSRTIEPAAATMDMHGAIDSLGSSDPVLVAFDYDPTSSGEMDLIASALIGHLMDQDARVVVVSLLPAGPATAQTLLDELTTDRPGYTESYGEQYANLGYLPGEAAGVRLLGLSVETALPRDFYGTPLRELPVMEGLNSAQDFALIVELAAAQDTLRWWIEQAGTPYSIPLGTGSSAAVVPIARPYHETESRQLVGLVGGVPDAATYEALVSDLNSPTSSSAARLDSQLAGQIVFILVILAGNALYFSRRGTRRER